MAHVSVLLNEVVQELAWTDPSTKIVDLTVGGGGHLEALLKTYPKPAHIEAWDQDLDTLEKTKIKLKDYPIQWEHQNFRYCKGVYDRILLDLGVSSFQLDEAHRGFSFQKDGPLDMRMDTSRGDSLYNKLMQCSEKTLCDVLFRYGEDKYAKSLARKWIEKRSPDIKTTKALIETLGFKLDSKDHHGKHPLTKVFQGLRIWVNDEFAALEELIESLPERLTPGGRVAIITFHSLEDRTVKWGLRDRLTPVHKKVIVASEEELQTNPRARSAKLRVYESCLKKDVSS